MRDEMTVSMAKGWKIGDRVRCYRAAPAGATGTIVAIHKSGHMGYKVRFDTPHPFTGETTEGWVRFGNIVPVDTAVWPTFGEMFGRRS